MLLYYELARNCSLFAERIVEIYSYICTLLYVRPLHPHEICKVVSLKFRDHAIVCSPLIPICPVEILYQSNLSAIARYGSCHKIV